MLFKGAVGARLLMSKDRTANILPVWLNLVGFGVL